MTKIIDPTAVHRTLLSNGLTVIIYRNPAAPVVAVNTYVKAGYFDETDDVTGIAHVLEHMFFKGTERLGVGEIAKKTKSAGGYLNAHTIYDHTSYYAVLPSRGFAEGLEVQADAYANSVIDAAELARELEVIIQEAARKEDNPGAVTTETLYSLLHDRHRIRRWRIGRPDALRTLTRDQLLAFYRNFYVPSNSVLAIAGDVDPAETLERVETLYGGIPARDPVRSEGPSEETAGGFRYRDLSGDVENTHAEIGWRTVGALHPDSAALDLASIVLGAGRASRLYRTVRDSGYASSVGAYNYSPRDVGVFVVSAQGPAEHAAEAARGLWKQIDQLRDGAVTAAEVDRAQQLFAARWARHLDTAEGQAAYLAEWESMGGWERGDKYLEAFMSLDATDVTRVARAYLDADQASAVVYRPKDTPALAADPGSFRALLDAGDAAPVHAEAPAPRPVPHGTRPPFLDRSETDVRVYNLESGVPLLARARKGSPIVHIGVYARTGSAYEPRERAGITALAARTSVRGTRTRSALQIAEESERLGGSIATSVSSESFGWAFSVPRENVAAAIELLSDVVQNAALSDERIETERNAMLAEVGLLRDDMYRYPMRLVQEAAYADHPYSIPAGGTDESLRTLEPAAAREWYARKMLAAPFVIGVVGDIDPDETALAVAASFTSLRMAERDPLPPVAWAPVTHSRSDSRDKNQSALALAFPGPARGDRTRFASHILASIASGLGGRFFDELRDRRSLAYTVHAFGTEHTLGGMFISYIATSPEKVSEAREGLLDQFRQLRETPVTEEELSRARRYLLGMHDIRQERGGAVLGDIIDAWMFGNLAELDAVTHEIGSVTAEEIVELANRYFDPATVVEGIVHGTPAMKPA